MVDKTPVRVVFDSSNVATGLGEFQTGETVPVANGGTGLSSLGAALTTLRVNSAGDALEFAAAGGDLDIRGDDSTSMVIALATQTLQVSGGNSITTSTSSTQTLTVTLDDSIFVDTIASNNSTAVQVNDGLNVSGTLSADTIDTNTISSTDSSGVFINDDLHVSGSITAEGSTAVVFKDRVSVNEIIPEDSSAVRISNLDVSTISASDSTAVTVNDGLIVAGNFSFQGGVAVSTILDEDDLSSDSATALATQQSIKAYVDSETASIVTTIGISDSSSNASTLTLGTNDLEFRAGNSITPTVAGTGVTFALNDDNTVDQIAAKDSASVSVTSPLQLTSTLQVAGVVSSAGTPTDDDHLTTVSYVNTNFARSGFPNSTASEFPLTTDSSATDFQEGSDGIGTATVTDAFGVALTTIFDCMEPIGSTASTNFGSDESHVGA